jgi:hypothetical protein
LESINKRFGVNWPMHANGTPKKIKDMTAEEKRRLARESLGEEFNQIPTDYLADFDRAFSSIFPE